mmetsp:Transcript_9982/g.23523  ORF Transcript_9982/g.23523 Transcript_9982/m.23523 type:complete len:350 (+) Transcript_9982:134-1183(+)
MYPVQDRSKAPGMMPGMIPGHPALYPDGRMKEDATAALQHALIAEYAKEEFQKVLYAGWHSTDDLTEKHKWRQEVCMEIQRVILPQYGFEGSRKGVYASGISCNHSSYFARAEEIGQNGRMMEWLVNPDRQEAAVDPDLCTMTNWVYIPPPKEGERPACGYEICVTQPDDGAIFNIAQMQGVLAGAHRAMHRDSYPEVCAKDWFKVLGLNKSVRESLEAGTLVYHARTADTGVVAGYISCTCCYGDGADEKPHGKINHVVVLDQHRGHGVGKMLFTELLDHLTEACPSVSADLRINVAERNVRAKQWYERLGFAPVEDWVAYPLPRAPVSFISMRRSLDAQDFDDLFGS